MKLPPLPRLAPRDARALAVGAVALTALLVVPRGGRAWLAWRAEARQAASEMTLELARTRAMLAGLEAAVDSAEARVARFREVGGAVFVVRQQAEAAARLAEAIREEARLASIRLDAMETRMDTASSGVLRRAAATVQATGDVAGLATLLQRLEARPTLLAVQQLSVQPQSVETPDHMPEALGIRFTVVALALVAPAR